MKNLLMQKDQQLLAKDQAYNEVLQMCARHSSNDKVLMTKLRELKFQHAEGFKGQQNFNTNGGFTTNLSVNENGGEGNG